MLRAGSGGSPTEPSENDDSDATSGGSGDESDGVSIPERGGEGGRGGRGGGRSQGRGRGQASTVVRPDMRMMRRLPCHPDHPPCFPYNLGSLSANWPSFSIGASPTWFALWG